MISDSYYLILRENIELKEKVKLLENIVIKEITINQLYTDIVNNSSKISDLQKENKILKDKFEILENNIQEQKEKNIYNNFLGAIYDLYTDDNTMLYNDTYNNYFINLKKIMKIHYRYIFEDDSENLVNKKKEYLLYQLNNCSNSVKKKLNKNIGNGFTDVIIDVIIRYLTDQNINLSNEEIKDVENWWIE